MACNILLIVQACENCTIVFSHKWIPRGFGRACEMLQKEKHRRWKRKTCTSSAPSNPNPNPNHIQRHVWVFKVTAAEPAFACTIPTLQHVLLTNPTEAVWGTVERRSEKIVAAVEQCDSVPSTHVEGQLFIKSLRPSEEKSVERHVSSSCTWSCGFYERLGQCWGSCSWSLQLTGTQ